MDHDTVFSRISQDSVHVTCLQAVRTDIDHTTDRAVSQQEPSSHTTSGLDELTQAMEALGRDTHTSPAQYINHPDIYTVRPRVPDLLADFLNHFTPDEQVKFLISTSCGPSSPVESTFLLGLTPGQQARFLSLHETDRKMLLTPAIDEEYKQHVIQEFVKEGTTKGLVGGW
ncbi:hypothetical protein D9619_007565 [Psilocybe cf. subviscida]|uniref:Uncharacterized protein n=1 Tax=Psilocybe cf. subviscida TaxID=2480587 RepID=A0A8H5EWW7_9AGAR|nr:hypothetical protein D9619_007565 [Psilocybe cf. subviscida]